MHRCRPWLPALFVLIAVCSLGSGLTRAQAKSAELPGSFVTVDSLGLLVEPPLRDDLLLLSLSIFTEDGKRILRQRSFDQALIADASGLQDGRYRFDAVILLEVPVGVSVESMPRMLRSTGWIDVQGGQITASTEDDPDHEPPLSGNAPSTDGNNALARRVKLTR